MMEINGSERRHFGPYEVDLHTHELWKHGVKVKLVGQPFEILAVLVRRPGELVTRDELRSQLWPGDTFVDFNHGLNAAVNKLRDALCDSAEDPKYIETLPRRGYRFVAKVEAVGEEPVEELAGTTQAAPVTADARAVEFETRNAEEASGEIALSRSGQSERPVRRRRIGFWLAGAVILAVVLAIFGVHFFSSFQGAREGNRAAERMGRGESAVPLTNLSDPTSGPAFSPDGTRVAFRRESFLPGMAGLYVKQVRGEELKQITADKDDCCPVWSPDGKWVAFSRVSDRELEILEVPAEGGQERRLYSTTTGSEHGELDWSPDGKSIAFAGRSAAGRTTIFQLSVESLKARPVTIPSQGESDWGPAFSPDGERLAFVRSGENAGQQNIMVMPAAGGEVRRVSAMASQLMGPPAWSSDGESIIFSASRENRTGLFRVASGGGVPTAIAEAPGNVSWPAVSRRGFRLAFQQVLEGRSILQLDLEPPGQRPRGVVMSASGQNAGPQFSPDGKRLLFFSDRLGGQDLWVSDRDGQNLVQLTAIGTAGCPRWSPDGKIIAFDVGLGVDWQQPRAIFTMNAEGGVPRPLVQDRFNNPCPSWSHDGRWIYFASDRSGDWQVWKVAPNGGTPVQITKQGGFAAWEGPDGNLYYAKHRYDGPELWRIPVGGGAEAPVYPPIRPLDWAAWTVAGNGILYVESGANNAPTLSFLDLSTLRTTRLAELQRNPFWLGTTSDGKTVVFDQPGSSESHIMVVENFR